MRRDNRQSPRMTLGIAANISIKDTRGCRIQSGASSVRYAAVAMPNGTAINSAIREETSVPYINGRAPNWSATGSQVDVTRKWNPNFLMAPTDPIHSSHPVRITSTTTVSAMAHVSHSNALSPKREDRAITWRADPGSPGAPKAFEAGSVATSMLPHITF